MFSSINTTPFEIGYDDMILVCIEIIILTVPECTVHSTVDMIDLGLFFSKNHYPKFWSHKIGSKNIFWT